MIINTKIISSLLGNVSLYLSVAMSVPLLYSFITVTKGSAEFLISTAVLVSLGILLKYYGKTKNMHMTLKDMFLFTSLVWITALFTSALPFILILKVDFITACYETASAISTSGSTVLGDLSKLPNSILLWRSILQYIGGIGFIAVGIAILPNLNVGGMKSVLRVGEITNLLQPLRRVGSLRDDQGMRILASEVVLPPHDDKTLRGLDHEVRKRLLARITGLSALTRLDDDATRQESVLHRTLRQRLVEELRRRRTEHREMRLDDDQPGQATQQGRLRNRQETRHLRLAHSPGRP